MLRKVDGPEILRRIDREGVTFMGGAPAVVSTILDRRCGPARSDPGRDQHAHRRGRSTAADGGHRTGRDRARLGVHADLRPHRDLAAADAQPPPGRVGRAHARPSGRGTSGGPARRRSASGCASTTTARCSLAATSSSAATGTQPVETAKVLARRVVPHRRRRTTRRARLPHDLRPQEGRHHHRRRERLLDRGRGRPRANIPPSPRPP